MRYVLLLAAALPMLAGCSAITGPTPAELYAQAHAACTTYGFKPETDAFASCMMQMDAAQQQQSADRRAAIIASLQNLRRPTVTCNTYGSANALGNTVYGNSSTTCQ